MKTLRFIALVHIALTAGHFATGATLASLVDARPTGGTATGTFVNNELPSFLLAPVSSTFGIRNAGSSSLQWQFAVGSNGKANVTKSTTINLSEVTSFTTAAISIDASAITFSADRFNPTDVGYVFAKVADEYFAFQVAKWSNNSNANTNGDRLRFYGAMPVTASLESGITTLTVVPEPGSITLLCIAATGLLGRRKS